MKYRILEENDKFYPQFFFLFKWFKFGEIYDPKIGAELYLSRDVSFNSLNEAYSFLNKEALPKVQKKRKIYPYP